MTIDADLAEMTLLVRDFALGVVATRDFIDRYANFYYYAALDGHEPSSVLAPGDLKRVQEAVELHRRIQEDVVNRISLDANFSSEQMDLAGRLTAAEARELALRICAEVGIEALVQGQAL